MKSMVREFNFKLNYVASSYNEEIASIPQKLKKAKREKSQNSTKGVSFVDLMNGVIMSLHFFISSPFYPHDVVFARQQKLCESKNIILKSENECNLFFAKRKWLIDSVKWASRVVIYMNNFDNNRICRRAPLPTSPTFNPIFHSSVQFSLAGRAWTDLTRKEIEENFLISATWGDSSHFFFSLNNRWDLFLLRSAHR